MRRCPSFMRGPARGAHASTLERAPHADRAYGIGSENGPDVMAVEDGKIIA
jgi:hypothetical protein